MAVKMSSPPGHTERPLLKSLLSGGVGGMCLVFVGQPFDLVKVMLQTQSSAGTAAIIRNVIHTQGFRGFYRGMSAPLAGVTPIFALCFWAFEAAKEGIAAARGTSTSKLSLSDVALAGALSAVPTTAIMAPGERIKVLLQVTGHGGNAGVKFTGPGDVVRTLLRTGGIRSLFAGSAATLARDGSGSMAYFSVYEGLKRRATAPSVQASVGPMDGTLSAPPMPVDCMQPQTLTASTVLMAGGLAGMANWLVALPIDTIKSRIQASAVQTGVAGSPEVRWVPPTMWRIGTDIVSKEGIRGLYRGLGPALLRAFPANAACFGGMEASRALLDKYM